jgi:hypothetical protein
MMTACIPSGQGERRDCRTHAIGGHRAQLQQIKASIKAMCALYAIPITTICVSSRNLMP